MSNFTKDHLQQIRGAALIRNRIEGAIKAASGPMSGAELASWPSITEIAGTNSQGKSKISYQLSRMVKEGFLETIGKGSGMSYSWVRPPESPTPAIPLEPLRIPESTDSIVLDRVEKTTAPATTDLHIRVNKAQHTVSFVFNGLSITIEVE